MFSEISQIMLFPSSKLQSVPCCKTKLISFITNPPGPTSEGAPGHDNCPFVVEHAVHWLHHSSALEQLVYFSSAWQTPCWSPHQNKVILSLWSYGHWLLLYFILLYFMLVACLKHTWVWILHWHFLTEYLQTIHVFFLSNRFIIFKADIIIPLSTVCRIKWDIQHRLLNPVVFNIGSHVVGSLGGYSWVQISGIQALLGQSLWTDMGIRIKGHIWWFWHWLKHFGLQHFLTLELLGRPVGKMRPGQAHPHLPSSELFYFHLGHIWSSYVNLILRTFAIKKTLKTLP